MKISDSTNTSTFLMSTPSTSLLKKNKSTKPFKFNRRLINRMTTLSKHSPPTMVPINNYQIIPASSFWPNTQLTSPNPILLSMNINPTPSNTSSSPIITSSLINQQQNVPVYPLSKPFTTPRVTTTLIPLNVCPSEYCQTVQSLSRPLIQPIENRSDQAIFENKSQGMIITHLIDDWIIRESSEPFRRKENERIAPIEQLINQEKQPHSKQSFSRSSNVNQWSIDDVRSFFEDVLGKNTYSSIIKEHLIDGTALLLLEDEHLTSIFKMQLGPRLKLLNRIDKLKTGDLSAV